MRSATPPAVVLELDCMTGLQTARILAGHGIPVVGVAADRRHFACRSRRVREVVEAVPDDLPAVLSRLAARRAGPFFVVPCSDRYVTALLACRSQWPEDMRIVLPEPEVAELLMDKARFAEFAEANGIPIPRTVVLRHADEAERCADLTYPLVVKPAPKPAGWDDLMGGKVSVVRDPQMLRMVIERGLPHCEALVVQEWVAGEEDALISFNGYFDRHSQPLAAFMARKLRQWPPKAGTSASGEEIRDDATLELSTTLFGKVNYRGLAYLEVKRDAKSGLPMVIEPNIGRPTGRSAISEAGGVELVYSAYRDALGMPPLADNRQKYTGVKWVYLRHDLQAAVVAIRSGELTIREWLRSLRGPKYFAVWSLTDPLPFFVDIFHAVRKLRSGGN